MNTTDIIECIVGFDSHVHFRKNGMLKLVTKYTARQFGGGFVMPNCLPKIKCTADAIAYQREIMRSFPDETNFIPKIAIYLTEKTDVDDVIKGFQDGHNAGVKSYPVGATTGSDEGISSIKSVKHILKAMESAQMPLHLHGETVHSVTGESFDSFNGETEIQFLNNALIEIMNYAPTLPIFLEHISMGAQAEFVVKHPNVRGTITPMHLGDDRKRYLNTKGQRRWNLGAMCLPTLKISSEVDKIWKWLVEHPEKFSAGTDSASHPDSEKENIDSGCACGAFCAPTALELYATAFDRRGQLHLFEQFITNGWRFQNLAAPEQKIKLVKKEMTIPPKCEYENIKVTPFRAGEKIPWTLEVPANDIDL